MEPAGQDHDERPRLGIDPEARPGEARVPEAPRPEQRPARAAIRRDDVPPETPLLVLRRIRRVDHCPDGQRAEDAPAVPALAPIQEHLRIDRHVIGRAEKPRVPRHAAQGPRPRVVDHSPEHRPAVSLRRREPPHLSRRRKEAGIRHAKRLNDTLPRESIEGRPRDPLDQPAEDLEADVAVGKPLARWVLEADRREPLPGLRGAVGVVADRIIRDEPAAMPEEHLHRHRPLAVGSELGQVADDRVLEPDLPAFEEDHRRGRRGDRLRQRGHIEDRVAGHRLGIGDEGPMSIRLREGNFSIPADQHDRASRNCFAAIDRSTTASIRRSRRPPSRPTLCRLGRGQSRGAGPRQTDERGEEDEASSIRHGSSAYPWYSVVGAGTVFLVAVAVQPLLPPQPAKPVEMAELP